MKKFIIRWALKQIQYLNPDKGALTYENLEEYGIADICVDSRGDIAYYLI